MKNGILFDTSVWIDFFSGIENSQTDLLTKHLKEDLPIYTCPTIIQELLQGIRIDKQYEYIKESLLALYVLHEDPVFAAIGAADVYRELRKKGVTIRKSNDCLIAYYALKNSINIVHRDRDFDLIINNLGSLKL